ncbi:hypothetical protein D3C78_1753620 [compost metagenome]
MLVRARVPAEKPRSLCASAIFCLASHMARLRILKRLALLLVGRWARTWRRTSALVYLIGTSIMPAVTACSAAFSDWC